MQIMPPFVALLLLLSARATTAQESCAALNISICYLWQCGEGDLCCSGSGLAFTEAECGAGSGWDAHPWNDCKWDGAACVILDTPREELPWYVVLVIVLMNAVPLFLYHLGALCICGCSLCSPVDTNSDDVHCCSTPTLCKGAFCCVERYKLPPIRVSKYKILIAFAIDIATLYTIFYGFGPFGLGLIFLGFTHNSKDLSEHPNAPGASASLGTAYAMLGLIYLVGSLLLMLTCWLFFVGAPIQLFLYYSWARSMSSLLRLNCNYAYKEVYHAGVPFSWGSCNGLQVSSKVSVRGRAGANHPAVVVRPSQVTMVVPAAQPQHSPFTEVIAEPAVVLNAQIVARQSLVVEQQAAVVSDGSYTKPWTGA